MYVITVKTFDNAVLKFKLKLPPEIIEGRVWFTDEVTGLRKSFPQNLCIIEEVKL